MAALTRFGALLERVATIFMFWILAAGAAQSDPLAWRHAQSLDALVEHLETWLDLHTDLPRPDTRATIRQISGARAAHMHSPRYSSQQNTTRGLYDPHEETIYLVRPWDSRNPFDVAVLLHELFHHRQKHFGYWYCPGAQELPAYRAQESWLEGLHLEADINWIAVVLEAGCTPRDIHPD